MSILDVFQRQAQQLFWRELPPDHVVGKPGEPPPGAPFGADEAYFTVRMREMYVTHARKLWRQYYPMLHGWVTHMGEETHAVAGPGQLQQLGDAGLDRAVILNYRLAGPIAYRGDEVTVLVGLYSIPGQDAAKALIDTVQTIAGLGGIALGQAVPIANAVKQGVENILQLNTSRLELGVRDSLTRPPLRPTHFVGIAAPVGDVPFDRLWLKEGRLMVGADPVQARTPYQDHDYMVIEIERVDTYDAWPGLPGMAAMQEKFSAIMADGGVSAEDKRKRLGTAWPEFTTLLQKTPQLIPADRKRIEQAVLTQLQSQLSSQNPFETRSVSGAPRSFEPRGAFDLLAVPDISGFVGAEIDPDALQREVFGNG